MDIFTINDRCTKCAACIDECPAKIIEKDEDNLPVSSADADMLCINCGHCVAVCPESALTHKNFGPAECPELTDELKLDMKRTEQFIRSRRSIRTYLNKNVEKEKLNKLIDLARYAPSAHNKQNVNWLIIYDTEKLRELESHVIDWMKQMLNQNPEIAKSLNMGRIVKGYENGINTICRGAPHLAIVHALKADPTSMTNCIIAMSYFELTAQSLGLGACWAGFFNAAANFWPPLQNLLKLPEGHTNYGAMMIGYPARNYYRTVLRNAPAISWM